jgi:uncharacterized protein (DUF1800 family)
MSLSRRTFLRVGAGAALLATVGCDQLPEEICAALGVGGKGPFQPPTGAQLDLIAHALNRLSFGAVPGEYTRVRALGRSADEAFAAYVEEQLAPEKLTDDECARAVRRFETLDAPAGEMFEYQPQFLHREMMRAALVRAVTSRRQLYEVMVRFWSDHFNIDPSKGDCKWLKADDDRAVIRAHALGRFPELLRASVLSPAMLWYLDGRVNRRARPEDRPNENHARELLELHTLGVHGGYTQRDVMEVARCLTGWTVRSEERFGKGQVGFKPKLHDDGAKEILGQRIPAGLGERDVDRVLNIIALHPATAHHLATKLCRHFIADAPPERAIRGAAGAFLDSQGDIRATLRALFRTPEFQAARGNRLKRPFHFVASALRATDARTDAGPAVLDYLVRMGHAPFSYPTPEGYPDEASPWLGTLLWRWNFALALSENRLPGTRVALAALRERCGGEDGLMAHLLGRQASAEEKTSYQRSGAGLALLLACPAFQRC